MEIELIGSEKKKKSTCKKEKKVERLRNKMPTGSKEEN